MEMLASMVANEPQNLLVQEIARIYQAVSPPEDQWDIRQSTDAAKLWLVFQHRQSLLVEQGWKLHVAAHPSSACEVLQRVLALLLQETSSFKIVASLQALRALNQGQYGWSQIGKFLTIYPSDEQEATKLASLLDKCAGALPAPKIPSDRMLHPGSLVHYRYGSFRGSLLLQEADGLISPAIRTPMGELLPDQRKHTYEAPTGRVDPFERAGLVSELPGTQRLLNNRYLLAGLLAASPTHTLYLAGDLQEARSCVVKGPGMLWEQGTLDTSITQSLRHEASILRELADIKQVPILYACLEQAGGVFLILEDIQGETLADYMKHVRSRGSLIEREQAIAWGKQIAELLDRLHSRGLVYADLKPSNILLASGGTLRLIDFELTDRQGSEACADRGTRGYTSPQRLQGLPLAITDDIYSLGALLYFIVTGAEPSEAPDATRLLARPPEWFSPAGASLRDIIARCLHAVANERYTSMQEILTELEMLATRQEEPPVSLADRHEPEISWEQLSQELLHTLCTHAQREPGQPGIFWRSAHTMTYGLAARDLNAGNAGTLLALAELVGAYPQLERQNKLAEAARWLQNAPFVSGQPLPGLYIGESGVGAALLRAGQILHENALIEAACERGRMVAALPYASPDLFNGTAGRLRFHLWLWDATGEQEHLRHALRCGQHLLASASTNDCQEFSWTLPQGYRGLSGQTYAGYAHGAAGIADTLLDLYEITADEQYLSAVKGVVRWLKRLAIVSEDDTEALLWPIREQEAASTPLWCHGGVGIGQFLLHASQHASLPDAGDLAARAARSVLRGTQWTNPTQCHGLAGSIEFLLDMYQASKQPIYYTQACSLAHCLAAFALKQDGLSVFASENPMVFTPDYMVGYGGVAVCILRLCEPEQRIRQLSRAGFRYLPRLQDSALLSPA